MFTRRCLNQASLSVAISLAGSVDEDSAIACGRAPVTGSVIQDGCSVGVYGHWQLRVSFNAHFFLVQLRCLLAQLGVSHAPLFSLKAFRAGKAT